MQKPLKCNVGFNYQVKSNQELFKNLPDDKIYLVRSQPCKEGQVGPYFEFKGSGKIEEGVLQGPGKLKIYSSYLEEVKTCITLSSLDGNVPEEVIGTFKDGLMEGNP